MFCPTCRGEFREGILVCPDCEVSLVPALPVDAADRQVLGDKPTVSQGTLIKRLWAGEVSLPITYWGFGFAGGLLLSLLEEALFSSAPATAQTALLAFGYLALLLFYLIFVSVAIWRAANRYPGPAVWVHLAKFSVVLRLIGILASILAAQ